MWDGEDDAADFLTLISLLQRKLDDCRPNQSPSEEWPMTRNLLP